MADVEIDPDEFLEAAMEPTEKEKKEEKKRKKEEQPKPTKIEKEVIKEMGKPKPTKEELQRHQSLINMARQFLTHARWQQYLEDNGFKYTPKELRALSTEELEELLERIQCSITNRHPAGFISTAQNIGLGIIENISQRPGLKEKYDLTGITQLAQQDDELQDALLILEIKYGMKMILSPETRYALSLVKLSAVVARQNYFRNNLLGQVPGQVPTAAQPPTATAPPQRHPLYDVEDEKEPEDVIIGMGLGGLAPEVSNP